MARLPDNNSEEDSSYEDILDLYMEKFGILDDDEVLVLIGVPGDPPDHDVGRK